MQRRCQDDAERRQTKHKKLDKGNGQTDRGLDDRHRQINRCTDRQTDRQTDKQTDRQEGRQAEGDIRQKLQSEKVTR